MKNTLAMHFVEKMNATDENGFETGLASASSSI